MATRISMDWPNPLEHYYQNPPPPPNLEFYDNSGNQVDNGYDWDIAGPNKFLDGDNRMYRVLNVTEMGKKIMGSLGRDSLSHIPPGRPWGLRVRSRWGPARARPRATRARTSGTTTSKSGGPFSRSWHSGCRPAMPMSCCWSAVAPGSVRPDRDFSDRSVSSFTPRCTRHPSRCMEQREPSTRTTSKRSY